MPCAASAAVGLRALQPDPGIVLAVGKVLMGSEPRFRDGWIPEKIQVEFLTLPQIMRKCLGKDIVIPLPFDFG